MINFYPEHIRLTHTRDGKGLYECWMFYVA